MNYKNRLERVQEKLSVKKLDGFIIINHENIRYISGFSGSSAVVIITPQKSFFLTDFRYIVQAEKEVRGLEIIIYKKQKEALVDLLCSEGLHSIGFESEHLSCARYNDIKKGLSSQDLCPERNLIETIRLVKEQEEIDWIKKSITIQHRALHDVMGRIKNGTSEIDVAVELDYLLRKSGAETIPFSTIVASGSRSAMPHAAPSKKKIEEKDLVVIDYGARYNGYHSDITRTIIIEGAEEKQKEIYDIVLLANTEAIKSIRPGVTASFIDTVARKIIDNAGYKDFFGHGTGHGVGLEIHEGPGIRWDDETVLEEGMVFTIEPGIYVPELGGVRIEDMVVVTKN